MIDAQPCSEAPKPRWRVWSWWTLGIVVAIPLLVAVSVAIWLFTPRTSTQPVAMGLYRGEVDGVPIVVEWPPYQLVIADPPQPAAGWTPVTIPDFLVESGKFFDPETADWSVTPLDDGHRLLITNQRGERLKLERLAVFSKTVVLRGATRGIRGRLKSTSVVAPRWQPATAWEARVLADRSRSLAAESWPSPWFDLEDFWSSWRGRSGPNEWEATERLCVVHRSPQLLSVLQHHWDYSGGAHGNSETTAITWFRDPRTSTVREVELGDWFQPQSPWRTRLVEALNEAYTHEQIHRYRESSPPETDPLTEAHLSFSWAVTPAGLRFYYPPYELGSYAAGEYVLLIPWAKLADLLADDGPAASLPMAFRKAHP